MDPSIAFHPAEGITYLDTATYGLAPRPTADAMRAALTQWEQGAADWIDDWDRVADRARREFSHLIGVPIRRVALVSTASVGVGTVAASLEADDEVLVNQDEFTSLLFPLLVAESRGVKVREVPLDSLATQITPTTSLVAFSLVQMQTGRVAPIREILARSEEVGARVLIDATHALPFVGVGGVLDRVDYVVCAAYKHLLCPRGTAFFVVRDDRQERLIPWNANWRAADEPYARYIGRPLSLADTAARFDLSMAWHLWVGAAESLTLLNGWRADGTLERPRAMAAALADLMNVAWSGSTLVCVPVADVAATQATLRACGVKAGGVKNAIRFSTHVYTTTDGIERAAAAMRGGAR